VIGKPPGPELEFIHNGVAGTGFAPNTEVEIRLNSNSIGTESTLDDGSVEFRNPFFIEIEFDPGDNTPLPSLRSGVHSVIVQETDDSGPHGAAHAIGFFEVPFGQVGDDAELINGALTLDNHGTAFDPCDSRAPVGVFTCTATFTNTTDTSFSNVFFEVDTLTGGNRVLNAFDGGGEGSRIAAPAVLNPGDSFVSEFEIGLENPRPFEFFVDAFGTPGGVSDHSGDPIDLTPQPTSSSDSPFVVDSFFDVVGPVNEFTSNQEILGSERDFIPDVFGTGATGEFLSTGESFQANLNFSDFGFGGANFIYDGVDGSHNRDFRGLGGIDLTNGGLLDEFVITVNNVEGTWFLQTSIHTDENNFLGGGGQLPSDGPFPQDVIFPLENFNSVGNPDVTDTGLIGVFAQNSPEGGEQITSLDLDFIGLRSSESAGGSTGSSRFEFSFLADLELEAPDVQTPFGAEGQTVLSRVVIEGQGSGVASAHTFERDSTLVDDGDPVSIDAITDLFYDVTFFDIDPDNDYESELGTSFTISGLSSTLETSFFGTTDTSKPNLGILTQATLWDWNREITTPLTTNRNLFIPDTTLKTDFTDQTLEQEFGSIFTDGFESGDTSAWSSSPPFTLATNGTLVIKETEVIPAH
jgi:hypothetical protein